MKNILTLWAAMVLVSCSQAADDVTETKGYATEFRQYQSGVLKPTPPDEKTAGFKGFQLRSEVSNLIIPLAKKNPRMPRALLLDLVRFRKCPDLTVADFVCNPEFTFENGTEFKKTVFFYYQTAPGAFHLANIITHFNPSDFTTIRDTLRAKYGKEKSNVWTVGDDEIEIDISDNSLHYSSGWGDREHARREALKKKNLKDSL